MRVWGGWGLPPLPQEGGFQKRRSARQKGKSMRRLREGLESGVLSLLERRRKSILSVSGRRQQVGREFSDSTPKGPARTGWESPKTWLLEEAGLRQQLLAGPQAGSPAGS